MKNFIKKLRPVYHDFIPSASIIGNTLLSKEYQELFELGKSYISNARSYSLFSDGWSNLRNEHMVNFVLVIPGSKPFFYRGLSIVGIPQTSINIANVEELGVQKCVSVVTDYASNMQGAWKILEKKYQHIFANGCGAHVMNLLIKDICDLDKYASILSRVQFVVKFIKERQHILAMFKDLRKQFSISHGLILTVPTRWYTHYNSCFNLLKAKFAVTSLIEEENLLNSIRSQEPEIVKILSFPTAIIGKFKSDKSDLFAVYDYFKRLLDNFDNIEGLDDGMVVELKEIVLARWNFIHTESMGFAHLLSPKSGNKQWVSQDKLPTKKQLKNYISVFYLDEDDIKKCNAELTNFTDMGNLSECLEEEYFSLSGLQYWSQYGKADYPLLAKIALRLFTIPTSSAASERVWSIYSFIHAKRRNRLGVEKVEKLVFIYINNCLLDSVDSIDYIADDENEEED